MLYDIAMELVDILKEIRNDTWTIRTHLQTKQSLVTVTAMIDTVYGDLLEVIEDKLLNAEDSILKTKTKWERE